MSKCVECLQYGRDKAEREVFACSLCGELRCIDHTIWVPSHELEKRLEPVENVHRLLRKGKYTGWYPFCGQGTHVPRGLPIRHGKERLGGKIVEPIIDAYKKPGLEFFRMWETGIIEAAIDNRWDTQHYALSCSLAASMVTIANLVGKEGITVPTLEKIFMTAITGLASKKSFFFTPSYDDFMKISGSFGGTEALAKYMCSRCSIVPCVNRLAEFHNSKIFKKVIKNPTLDKIKK
ncbi:MAG: hypothetical protein ACW98Y_20140 [Candidatus Thorarchaeota archaeon]|jgi:hypothetical protein